MFVKPLHFEIIFQIQGFKELLLISPRNEFMFASLIMYIVNTRLYYYEINAMLVYLIRGS